MLPYNSHVIPTGDRHPDEPTLVKLHFGSQEIFRFLVNVAVIDNEKSISHIEHPKGANVETQSAQAEGVFTTTDFDDVSSKKKLPIILKDKVLPPKQFVQGKGNIYQNFFD